MKHDAYHLDSDIGLTHTACGQFLAARTRSGWKRNGHGDISNMGTKSGKAMRWVFAETTRWYISSDILGETIMRTTGGTNASAKSIMASGVISMSVCFIHVNTMAEMNGSANRTDLIPAWTVDEFDVHALAIAFILDIRWADNGRELCAGGVSFGTGSVDGVGEYAEEAEEHVGRSAGRSAGRFIGRAWACVGVRGCAWVCNWTLG